jgi:zinc-binding alcohol dehydrogenase/oxidoreductase
MDTNLTVLMFDILDLAGTAMGSPEDFDGLLNLVNSKRIIPVVDQVFPFDQFPSALEKMRKGGQFGKLVLDHSTLKAKL